MPNPVPRRIRSTGVVELVCHDLGGSGPALLVAHGTGLHGPAYGPLARHLPGFRCWAPDLRGHGDSTTPPGEDYHWRGFGDDVLAVVDAFGDGPLFGVGHSMGAAALILAEERRPGTFHALYAYEPIIFPPDILSLLPAESPVAVRARRRREVFPTKDAAYENYASKPPLRHLTPEALRAYVDHGFEPLADGTVRLKCRARDEAQMYRMNASHDAFDGLQALACPVTLARGEVQARRPSSFVDALASQLTRGRVEAFDDLSHFGPLEDPARVAASIATAFCEVD